MRLGDNGKYSHNFGAVACTNTYACFMLDLDKNLNIPSKFEVRVKESNVIITFMFFSYPIWLQNRIHLQQQNS